MEFTMLSMSAARSSPVIAQRCAPTLDGFGQLHGVRGGHAIEGFAGLPTLPPRRRYANITS
jgi:hypothetical protein